MASQSDAYTNTNTNTNTKEVTVEFQGLIRAFKDGSVDRLWECHEVPASPDDPKTGVASKDVAISPSTGLSARLYLPKLSDTHKKLPILVYFHGGAFCVESASSNFTHPYMNTLASQAQALVVSVDYRLAPEHPLPTAYEDCWEALNWVPSLADPWLASHGDLDALFIGGDSAGATIVHYILMKAGKESLDRGVRILGAFLSQSYFLNDKSNEKIEIAYRIWDFVYPNAPGGWDSPLINPMVKGAPSLAGLGCSRVLVIVSSDDILRDSGVSYYEAVKQSGFGGQVELFEVEGEGHCFHIITPESENAKLVFQRLASFLRK